MIDKVSPLVCVRKGDSLLVSAMVDPEINLQAKINPLADAQAGLIVDINKLSVGRSVVASQLNYVNDALLPISKTIQSVGATISAINKIATNANLLSKITTYDFVNQPLLSILSSATDSIRVSQERLLACMPNVKPVFGKAILETPQIAGQISALGGISLHYAERSPTSFVSIANLEKSDVDVLKERVGALELKIEKLENEKRNIELTDITKNVSDRLEKISSDLAKCFRGAMNTLIIGKSEDLVGQTAESLTRVVMGLPFLLTSKKGFSSKKKEEQIKEALEDYLGLDCKCLIEQQHGYYAALSDIRHRNPGSAVYYKDKNLFKAFVIQIEAYIYMLVTYERRR